MPRGWRQAAGTIVRLKQAWPMKYQELERRHVYNDTWVYTWTDGIYSDLRAKQARLLALVIFGVNLLGEQHFPAIGDGVRESAQSWRGVLLDLNSRCLKAPQLAPGDGAMRFWSALDEIRPDTRHQRCWGTRQQTSRISC